MTISLLKVMMRPKSLYEKTRSVVNITSEYTCLVGLKKSLDFLTLLINTHTFKFYIDLFLTLIVHTDVL